MGFTIYFSVFMFTTIFQINHVMAQFIGLGLCPDVYAMKNFNITEFAGTWYEVEKYPFVPEETTACITTEYFDKDDSNTFGLNINLYEKLTGRKFDMPGITKLTSGDGSANVVLDLLVTLSPVPFRFRFPYILIDTDYSSYVIKYRCQQFGVFNAQFLWILSRNRTFSPEVRKIVHTKLHKLGLDTSNLLQSDQNYCP